MVEAEDDIIHSHSNSHSICRYDDMLVFVGRFRGCVSNSSSNAFIPETSREAVSRFSHVQSVPMRRLEREVAVQRGRATAYLHRATLCQCEAATNPWCPTGMASSLAPLPPLTPPNKPPNEETSSLPPNPAATSLGLELLYATA